MRLNLAKTAAANLSDLIAAIATQPPGNLTIGVPQPYTPLTGEDANLNTSIAVTSAENLFTEAKLLKYRRLTVAGAMTSPPAFIQYEAGDTLSQLFAKICTALWLIPSEIDYAGVIPSVAGTANWTLSGKVGSYLFLTTSTVISVHGLPQANVNIGTDMSSPTLSGFDAS
jgi:hypothetical protein